MENFDQKKYRDELVRRVADDQIQNRNILQQMLNERRKQPTLTRAILEFLYVLDKTYDRDDEKKIEDGRRALMEYFARMAPVSEDEEPEESQNVCNNDEVEAELNQPDATQIPPAVDPHPHPTPISRLVGLQPTAAQMSSTIHPHSHPTPISLSVESRPKATQVSSALTSQPTPITRLVGLQPTAAQMSSTLTSQPTKTLLDILPDTDKRYQCIRTEAHRYRDVYEKIDNVRKRQLSLKIKDVMNKLRKETYSALRDELFQFLNGQEQQIAGQKIKIENHAERLLTLSILATSISAQLLGGDLTDIKTEIFLPLVRDISMLSTQKEFQDIFLGHLYQKCPYAIPLYPERQVGMSEEEYFKTLGYIEKRDDTQRRLETEAEFLNRMNGLIRLFCKLLVCGGPPFDEDLRLAWAWFADVLNLEPRENITAVLIRVFLDEAGQQMFRVYKAQFVKLVKFIETQTLKALEPVTSRYELELLQCVLKKCENFN